MDKPRKSPNGKWVDLLCIASGFLLGMLALSIARCHLGEQFATYISIALLVSAALSAAYLYVSWKKNSQFDPHGYGIAMGLYGGIAAVYVFYR